MPVVEVVIAAVAALASVIQAVGQSKVSFPRSRKGSLDKVVTNLKTARDNLEEMKIDFENDVTLGSYMDWPRKVRRIQNEMSNLVAQYENAQGSRHSDFTKGLNKLHKIVEDVVEEGNKIIEVMSQPPEPYKARDITKFPTLQGPFEDILRWLGDDTVKGISIHGAVGSGKTNIMFNLVKHEKVVPNFDVIIWLAVSREGNKENLSKDWLLVALSKKLKLDVRDINSLVEVRTRVSDALEDKKYLLLLDDVKENIDLIELGIPSGKPGSKVVLTTRNRHVCNLLVNQAVKVSFLEDKEAQEMFREVVADSRLDADENIKWVARRVCKECYGVPLYIDKVASTFKLKMKEELWTEALSKLRYWPEKEYEGIREVYRTLRFCYDDLDDDRRKRCFLYGVLYPEGENIENSHLLECWEAEELLGNKEEARRHGHDVLNHLTNVSLLEEGEKENHVTMHSFIRQMALHVAESENPPLLYLVQTSSGLDLAPTVETWKEMSGISFANNSLEQLPESPSCSKLSTLFLNKNEELKKVSPSFFEHAKDLRVLDLSETGIELLPSSAAKLRKLRNLYLNDCKHLKELPAKITKLQKLETLDIRRTGFCQIPPVVEKLIGLKRLRVSLNMSTSVNANPQGTFSYSKLCALEELIIDVDPTVAWSMVLADILKEVASLNKLRILKVKTGDTVVDVINVVGRLLLRISISEATILRMFIEKQLQKEDHTLRPFWVLIGCENTEKIKLPDEKYIERYVRYRNGAGSTFPAAKVLAVADCFELLDHAEIKQLSDFGTMKRIKYCFVENCNVLETIVGSTTEIVLPILEDLYVKQLPKLASIFTGQLLRGSLAKLQTLVFTECDDLKLIFARDTTKQLGSIQHLEIESCAGIAEVIDEFEARGNQKLLPKLKKLILRDLPALTTICKVDSLEWASLEELEISECPLLCDFPFNTNNAKKLKVIKGDQGCRDAINNLTNQQVKDRLLKVAVAGA